MPENPFSQIECSCGAAINLASLEGNPDAHCPRCQTPLSEIMAKLDAGGTEIPDPTTSARVKIQKTPSGRFQLPPKNVCINHPDKHSHGECHMCAKPICFSCANEFGPFCGAKCKEEFQVLLNPDPEPPRPPEPEPEPPKGLFGGLLKKFRKDK